MLGRDVLGTIVEQPRHKEQFHVVLWDNGNKINVYTNALEQVTPVEELALVHNSKKNPNSEFSVGCRVKIRPNPYTQVSIHKLLGTIVGEPDTGWSPAFRSVRWDNGSLNRVHISSLEQVTPLEELALVHKTSKNNPKKDLQAGTRVKVLKDYWVHPNCVVGTIYGPAANGYIVLLDSGGNIFAKYESVLVVSPIEELARTHTAKKNSPKYPKFKVNDVALVQWVENDKRSDQIGRIVSIEGQFATLLTQRGMITVGRQYLEEVPPLEALARVRTNSSRDNRKSLRSGQRVYVKCRDGVERPGKVHKHYNTDWWIIDFDEGSSGTYACSDITALSDIEMLARTHKIENNPAPTFHIGETVVVDCRDGGKRIGTVQGRGSYRASNLMVLFHDGTTGSYHYTKIKPVSEMEMLSLSLRTKNNPRKQSDFRKGQQVVVKCKDGKERFGIVHGHTTDSFVKRYWIVDFHDGSTESYHYMDIEPLSDLEMLSRTGAKKNPVIKYLRGKDAEGVRAGVKNSLQYLNSRLFHLRSLIEAHDCGSLQADEEYDQTWDDIWHGVRDLTKR
jgi:rubredoxin